MRKRLSMKRRSGFTLIELLVTMAIAGSLAALSLGSYSILTRGIEERGVLASATACVRAASQRAKIDGVPCFVWFYNRCLLEKDSSGNPVMAGFAVVIRRMGRISNVDNQGNLCDEFGDLDQMYTMYDQNSLYQDYELPPGLDIDQAAAVNALQEIKKVGAVIRLYRFDAGLKSASTPKYADVYDTVYRQYIAESPWCVHNPESDDYEEDPDAQSQQTQQGVQPSVTVTSFVPAGAGVAAGDWIGKAYGLEIASLRLPKNFIFGKQTPKTDGSICSVDLIYCDPAAGTDDALKTVPVSALRVSGNGEAKLRNVGRTSAHPESET